MILDRDAALQDWLKLSDLHAYPRRIVCLTEETTETLYLLGEEARVVGVSGYTARLPEARLKPKVSAFTSAKFDKILALNPDLVLAFSDLQADIVRELATRGLNVVVFNQRSIPEILQMMLMLSRIVGVMDKGIGLVNSLRAGLLRISHAAANLPASREFYLKNGTTLLSQGFSGLRNSSNLQAAIRSFRTSPLRCG